MSDSDDTDVLLLIPPDFFFQNNNLNNQEIKSQTPLQMSQNYNHLPPRHRLELKNIDAQLSEIEKNLSFSSNNSAFSNDNKIHSSLNYHLQYDDDDKRKNTNLINFSSLPSEFLCRSTPKFDGNEDKDKKIDEFSENENNHITETDNIINEIDNFLQKNENFRKKCNSNNTTIPSPSTTLASMNFDLSPKRHSSKLEPKEDDNNCLLSLDEMWNKNPNDFNENLSLHEERLRRQHCEKTIQKLQNNLLEYQQKISIAIHIDKSKDNALDKLQEENRRLRTLTNDLDEKLMIFEKQKNELSEKLRLENDTFKIQKESLENELSQALNLAAKFQDKNEILEMKVENLTRASTEIGSIYKKQIEDMETKLSNYQKNEEINNEELNRTKIKYENVQEKNENLNKMITELNNQLEIQKSQIEQLKHDKNDLSNKISAVRNKCNELEKRNKELEDGNLEVTKKEKSFIKELESQRVSLKSYYQQQLESVVAQKIKEFQMQLDQVELQLKTESKEREHLLAERAMKQVELINEKSEQEITLLNEKHREEVELYRIQLLNSSRKIDDLERKLEDFRTRRADIAEKLHNVMETQWKKALEILTSPNCGNNDQSNISNNREMFSSVDKEKLDGFEKCNKFRNKAENENFETPTTSAITRYTVTNNNNQPDQKNIDRLQAYIEMLLNKSPNDLENLQEILAMPKLNQNRQTNKNEKHKNVSTMESQSALNNKPPWR